MQTEPSAGVKYQEVDSAYFEKRGLRKHARALHLWALGVGAVISGDFSGWNLGLSIGGFGGMLAATAIITLMYFGLCYSIAEMSPALPHAGGAYSFARSSMGPWAGYLTGLAENMEYILTPAAIVFFIGGYLGDIFGTTASQAPLWWAGCYLIFVGLNVWGVEITFRFSIVITAMALAILTVFYISAIPKFDLHKYALDIPPDPGFSAWLPKGWKGILGCLPFAIWFYLAIEELPLAAEESHDPINDMPKGLVLGIMTLSVFAFLTLVLNSGISPGAKIMAASDAPLLDGFKTTFGAGTGSKILALIAVAGLVASFHTIIFAYGRQIFSLSRAGYFPTFLSLTHGTRNTPHVALIAGSLLGLLVLMGVRWAFGKEGQSIEGGLLLNMAVFGAVISYIFQMLSYIMLRIKMPNIPRPYKSPMGVAGAVIALLISVVTLVTLFYSDPIYRKVVVAAAIWYALGCLYFAFHSRHRLIKSPEEEFAINNQK